MSKAHVVNWRLSDNGLLFLMLSYHSIGNRILHRTFMMSFIKHLLFYDDCRGNKIIRKRPSTLMAIHRYSRLTSVYCIICCKIISNIIDFFPLSKSYHLYALASLHYVLQNFHQHCVSFFRFTVWWNVQPQIHLCNHGPPPSLSPSLKPCIVYVVQRVVFFSSEHRAPSQNSPENAKNKAI